MATAFSFEQYEVNSIVGSVVRILRPDDSWGWSYVRREIVTAGSATHNLVEKVLYVLINERKVWPSTAWAFLEYPYFDGYVHVVDKKAVEIFETLGLGFPHYGKRGGRKVYVQDFEKLIARAGEGVTLSEFMGLLRVEKRMCSFDRDLYDTSTLCALVLNSASHLKTGEVYFTAEGKAAWNALKTLNPRIFNWLPEKLVEVTPEVFQRLTRVVDEFYLDRARSFSRDMRFWRTTK